MHVFSEHLRQDAVRKVGYIDFGLMANLKRCSHLHVKDFVFTTEFINNKDTGSDATP